ncbi:MAG: hypothetical protein ABIO36_08980 [Pyrinomonadaceae bacterium]
MKTILLLVIGLVGGVTIGAVAMHFLYSSLFGETPMNYQTIYFPKVNVKIYTLARIWGITGNHEEVRLCSEPYEFDKKDQANECVVFFTDRIYYKKDGATSLQIYALSSSIPVNIKDSVGSIRISVKALKNFDEDKDFEQNFENYGLMTIAAP